MQENLLQECLSKYHTLLSNGVSEEDINHNLIKRGFIKNDIVFKTETNDYYIVVDLLETLLMLRKDGIDIIDFAELYKSKYELRDIKINNILDIKKY